MMCVCVLGLCMLAYVQTKVNSPPLTPFTPQADEKRRHVEVCPEGGVVIQRLANRIAEDGGAALIADYGHDGTKMDTFRVSVRNLV